MNYSLIVKVCGVITLVILMFLQSIIGTIGFLLIALVIFIFLFIFSFIRDRKLNNKTYTRDTRISVNTTLDLIKNCTLDRDRKE
jgi:ABC-type bacteriocin/lantibiotic exporter with double-glycine peptidase domain